MPNPITVTLTQQELHHAGELGHLHWEAVQRRQAQRHGQPPRLRSHIIGIMGEMAFAKWSGLPWVAPKGNAYSFASPDVGNCEVRTRYRKSGTDVLARSYDQQKCAPSRLVVLAWAEPLDPHVQLVGYTTIGTIVDYGEFIPAWNCYSLAWQSCLDLKELFHGAES